MGTKPWVLLQNSGFCRPNLGFCSQNPRFCIKTQGFVHKTQSFVTKPWVLLRYLNILQNCEFCFKTLSFVVITLGIAVVLFNNLQNPGFCAVTKLLVLSYDLIILISCKNPEFCCDNSGYCSCIVH